MTVAISSQPASLCLHFCSLTFELPCAFYPEVSELFILLDNKTEQMGQIPDQPQLQL